MAIKNGWGSRVALKSDTTVDLSPIYTSGKCIDDKVRINSETHLQCHGGSLRYELGQSKERGELGKEELLGNGSKDPGS